MAERSIALYLGPEHPCPYLPGRTAASAYVDPASTLSPPLFGRLLEHGFQGADPEFYLALMPIQAGQSAEIVRGGRSLDGRLEGPLSSHPHR